MEPRPDRGPGGRTRRWAPLVLLAAALPLVVVGAGVARPARARADDGRVTAAPPTAAPASNAPAPVVVAGHAVRVPAGTTVAAAAHAAGVHPPYGRVRAVVDERVVPGQRVPPVVRVDGHPATLASRLRPGDVVSLHRPADRMEPLRAEVVTVRPVEPAGLYVGTRPGTELQVRGADSGQLLTSRSLQPPDYGRLRTPGTVTLTFDDGPAFPATGAILDLLDVHHVRAVFCEIGVKALAHPLLVRQVVADGNLLCDHTAHHPDDMDRLPAATVTAEITDGYDDIVHASGGTRPLFYRSPQGRWTAHAYDVAVREHLRNLYWTVDPMDWSRPGAAAIVDRVIARLRPGGVVLMHDGDGNREQTVAALAQLLDLLPRMGYTFTLPTATDTVSLRGAERADAGTRAFAARWQRMHHHPRTSPAEPARAVAG